MVRQQKDKLATQDFDHIKQGLCKKLEQVYNIGHYKNLAHSLGEALYRPPQKAGTSFLK